MQVSDRPQKEYFGEQLSQKALGLEEGMSLRKEKTKQEFKDCMIKELQAGKARASCLRYLRASCKTQAWEWHFEISILKATPIYQRGDLHGDGFHLVPAEHLES